MRFKRQELQANMSIAVMNMKREFPDGGPLNKFRNPSAPRKFDYIDHSMWGILKLCLKSLSLVMVVNACNVLIVRMQNIDYEHHKSLRRAVVDILRNDKHRALYKGLLPQIFGFNMLNFFGGIMHMWR